GAARADDHGLGAGSGPAAARADDDPEARAEAAAAPAPDATETPRAEGAEGARTRPGAGPAAADPASAVDRRRLRLPGLRAVGVLGHVRRRPGRRDLPPRRRHLRAARRA